MIDGQRYDLDGSTAKKQHQVWLDLPEHRILRAGTEPSQNKHEGMWEIMI